MGSIILASFLGLLVGAFLFAISMMISTEVSYRAEKVMVVIGVILLIGCIIFGGIIGGNLEAHDNNEFIQEYKIIKESINNSLINENISGFERVELVKQATELTSELIRRQYNSQQWYGFLIPDEILELEPITFEVE